MIARRLGWPWPPAAARLLLVLLWVAGWEATVRLGLFSRVLVAAPSETAAAMAQVLANGDIRSAFLMTLWEFVLGFAIAAVAGFALGVALGSYPLFFRILNSPLMVLYGTPKSIFLPLFVVFLGLGYRSPAAFTAISAVFPIMISVIAGMRGIDHRLVQAADALGASPLQKVRFLVLPGALPAIIAGLWLGIKQALLAVLLAELFISGGHDIGYWIAHFASTFEPASVYALVAWLSVFAIGLGLLWRRVEAYASRWRGSNEHRLTL